MVGLTICQLWSKEIRIDGLDGGDVVEQPFEMACHGQPRAVRIVGLDRGEDRFVLADHLRHATDLGQRQPTEAVDMHLYLQDQRPDSGIASDIGDGGMKRLVRLMKRLAVPGVSRLALPLQCRM